MQAVLVWLELGVCEVCVTMQHLHRGQLSPADLSPKSSTNCLLHHELMNGQDITIEMRMLWFPVTKLY